MPDKGLINVGEISGVFGIKGWIKVFSFTHARENILSYSPWLLKKGSETRCLSVIDGSMQSKTVIAKLDGINDRDAAAALIGWEIYVTPEQLPEPAQGEYYWSDLIGLTVETTAGAPLGLIDNILATGANDVLIIKCEKERAIPFLQGKTITSINLEAGKMIVVWDPDF